MAARRRTAAQIQQDRAIIARLYLQGRTQAEIGRERGMTQQMVSHELAVIRKTWERSGVMDFNARKEQELARLDLLETEAWQEWERSKEPRKKETGKVVEGTSGATGAPINREEASSTTEEREGNVAYLNMVLSIIDRRIKLFGLDAPVETVATLKLVKLYKDVDMDLV